MQGVDQLIDGGHCLLLRHLGQVSIASCCGGTGMAKQTLNMAQAQAPFEQMSGKAVAQGMD